MLGGSSVLSLEHWGPTRDKVMLKFNEGMPIHDCSYLFPRNKSHHIS